MPQLRIYDPDFHGPQQPQADWPLDQFFREWYLPQLRARKRRPVQESTIVRRQACLKWWVLLMPERPALDQITEEMLDTFVTRLRAATWRRTEAAYGRSRKLSEASIYRTVSEVVQVLSAAGKGGPGQLRAGILTEIPMPLLESPCHFPRGAWAIEEARAIYAAISHWRPTRTAKAPDTIRRLLRAVIGLWYFSGHRATTYTRLHWSMLSESQPNEWFLQIPASIKTQKPDLIRVHPQLLVILEACRGLHPLQVIPLNTNYRTLYGWHQQLCHAAGIRPSRRLGPQGWRRFHAQEMGRAGLAAATTLVQQSMGHSSAAITNDFYFSVRNLVIPNLPPLF